MILLLQFFLALYLVFFCLLIYHFNNLKEYGLPEVIDDLPTFSVIIAVRNEADNIINLLDDLAAQTYPTDKFSVVVIDDASTDNTYNLVNAYIAQAPFKLKLISLQVPEGTIAYKKTAIQTGIKQAEGKLIITTDGDCRVGRDWLLSFAGCHKQTQAKLISGLVTFYQEKGIFQYMQTIEFASLVGSGAAAMQAGMPVMCNGANLCYENAAFEKVGGFNDTEHIPSGDDEHLMHKIVSAYPGQLVFNKSQKALVTTKAKSSFEEFKQQRLRWAGKWKYNADIRTKLLAIFLFGLHLLLLLAVAGVVTGLIELWSVAFLFIAKFAVEGFFLGKVLKSFGKQIDLAALLLLQLVYPVYVVYFGVKVNFSRQYNWKGRKIAA
jgi:cellulose synthase/poly-beta-1,6-N-acetylglucosamine synthase-like glycosyltransferase